MSLIQMSAAAGILILGIVLFRSLFVHRLPKKVMILLWEIAILRLLLPFAIPLPLPEFLADARSMISTETSYAETSGKFYSIDTQILDGNWVEFEISEDAAAVLSGKAGRDWSTAVKMIYLLVTAVMLCGSLFLYIKDSRLFKEALPMSEQEKERLITLAAIEDKDLRRLRKVKFMRSDRTATPVTYGLIHPAIVFPKGLHLQEDAKARFYLRHELVHIRNYDNCKKLLAHLTLCIHWFNPLVWVMYLLFNRDMELMCDERVVRLSGERQDYALTLLSMAAGRNIGFRTGLGFGKNAVKERILAVMTFKKTTLTGTLAAILAVTAALTVFITNADDYDMSMTVFASSQEYADQKVNVAVEGTEMTTTVVEDVPLNLAEQEYAGDVIQMADITQSQSGAEYTISISTATAAAVEDDLMEERAEVSDTTRSLVEELVDELGVYGLSVQFTENDYQLYYDGEPICFFADNKAKVGFSGRVFAQSSDGTYGDTGVITKRNDDGEIIGLIQLSEKESKIYSELWW